MAEYIAVAQIYHGFCNDPSQEGLHCSKCSGCLSLLQWKAAKILADELRDPVARQAASKFLRCRIIFERPNEWELPSDCFRT